MKIKNLVIYYPSFERGGVEKIIKNLINYFSKFNLNIYLISEQTKNLKILKKKKNIFLIHPSKRYFKFLPNRYATSLNCLAPFGNLLNNLSNKDTVVHSMQSSYLPIIVSKFNKFKIVIRNSEDPIASTKYADKILSSYIIFLLRFLFYNLADRIITNSKGSAKSLKFFMFGKNKEKVQFIYNPYLTKKKIESAKKKNKKQNLILSVGRLCKQKNFKDLIIAFANFSKKENRYILKIVGQGYQKNYLNSLIKSLNMEKKIFLKGYIENIDKEYRNAKLFVLPSLYEGLGNVLIDALNFSVPCIATNCKSGPKEILCHGKAGAIIPVHNPSLIKNKIEEALDNYSKKIKKVNYGRKKLFRFDADKQSRKYLAFLNSTLG